MKISEDNDLYMVAKDKWISQMSKDELKKLVLELIKEHREASAKAAKEFNLMMDYW